jgi:hypothetical protein
MVMTQAVDRQKAAVAALRISPRIDCTISHLSVETIGRFVLVFRKYHPNHAPSITYTEHFRIGPRGGVEVLSRFTDV